MEHIWWKHGVIYHIYPRSFYDSNGDGIGDIQGIIEKLDYLIDLGVNAIWLSPIYQSPQVDFGYDISDHYAIDHGFGTMHDFDTLVELCHKKGIKIIMDLIMNHTSAQHPWFLESSSSIDNPKRDWYIWSQPNVKKPANNWMSAFGGSAWTFHPKTQSFYLHSFHKEQPDLNWRNQEMADAFFNMVNFWLEKGVDGFRLDVVNFIVKDKHLRNNPVIFKIPFLQQSKYNRNRPYAFKVVEQLRTLLDNYPERMIVGEIYVLPPGNPKTVAKFIKSDKRRLHMAFDFSILFKSFTAKNYFTYIKKWNKKLENVEWACHVFSNHDLGRNINRLPFKRFPNEKAKITALFQFTIPGTPFIYYGEELGMRNINIPKKYLQDPLGKKFWPIYSGRDKYRTPMQWDINQYAGFSSSKPWLPIDNDYKNRNVKSQSLNPDSLYHFYKKILSLRNSSNALKMGDWQALKKGKKGVLSYIRKFENEEFLIILNFKNISLTINLAPSFLYRFLINTHPIENEILNNQITILPFQGLVLELSKVE